MTLAENHVFRAAREIIVLVEPEERAVIAFAVGCRRGGVFNPSFRENTLAVNAAVVKIKLTEAGKFRCSDVNVRRAERRAAYILLKDAIAYAQRDKQLCLDVFGEIIA